MSDDKDFSCKTKFKGVLKRAPLALLATIVATALLCSLTSQVGKIFGYELNHQLSLDILKNLHGLKKVCFIAYAALLMPVLEEIAFRFAAFMCPALFVLWLLAPAGKKVSLNSDRLEDRLVIAFFALGSSVLFSAAHYFGPAKFPDNAFVALGAFGLIQCWLYRRNSTILAPIVNHVLFNAVNIFLCLVLDIQ